MNILAYSVSLTVLHRGNTHNLPEITVKGALRLKPHRKIHLGYITSLRLQHIAGVSDTVLVQHSAKSHSEILLYQMGKVSRMVTESLGNVFFMEWLRVMLAYVVRKPSNKAVIALCSAMEGLILEILRRYHIKLSSEKAVLPLRFTQALEQLALPLDNRVAIYPTPRLLIYLAKIIGAKYNKPDNGMLFGFIGMCGIRRYKKHISHLRKIYPSIYVYLYLPLLQIKHLKAGVEVNGKIHINGATAFRFGKRRARILLLVKSHNSFISVKSKLTVSLYRFPLPLSSLLRGTTHYNDKKFLFYFKKPGFVIEKLKIMMYNGDIVMGFLLKTTKEGLKNAFR